MLSRCGYGRGLSRRFSQSSGLMYLCGKAIHASRREDKAFKQVLGTPPGGDGRNVVKVQQHPPFRVESRQSGNQRQILCSTAETAQVALMLEL